MALYKFRIIIIIISSSSINNWKQDDFCNKLTTHFKSASCSSKADTLNILMLKLQDVAVTLDNNREQNKHVVSCQWQI